MSAPSGAGQRSTATYTVELLGAFGKTPEQAAVAVGSALSVPLDRAQRLLGGKRFRITVTASPPNAEASPAVTKLLASGVDLAILDEETGERRELYAPRPKNFDLKNTPSTRVEATGRFKLTPEPADATGKPPSTTGLKPIRLVEASPRASNPGREVTGRFSTQQLLDGVDAAKPSSRGGMAPVATAPARGASWTPPSVAVPPGPRSSAPDSAAPRDKRPSGGRLGPVRDEAPASRRPGEAPSEEPPRSKRPSGGGLPPVREETPASRNAIRDEPTGGSRLPPVVEGTQRITARYTMKNGEVVETVSTLPPSSRPGSDSSVPPPPSSRGGGSATTSSATPPSASASPRPVSSAPPAPTPSAPGAASSTSAPPGPAAPSSSPGASDPAPSVSDVPPAPPVPTSLVAGLLSSSPPGPPCSDCAAPLGAQAPLCGACGWDGERKVRRCGRCGGALAKRVAVGSAGVVLTALGVAAPVLAGGALGFLVDPLMGGGGALLVAVIAIAVRSLLASPRCRACGWVAPPPTPKAKAAKGAAPPKDAGAPKDAAPPPP